MILELNTCGKNIPTTSAKYSKNIMKYQKIEKEKRLQSFTWKGTITPGTMTAPPFSL